MFNEKLGRHITLFEMIDYLKEHEEDPSIEEELKNIRLKVLRKHGGFKE